MTRIIFMLARVFWEVSALRKGPQDMPAYPALLAILLLIHLVIEVLRNLIIAPGTDIASIITQETVYQSGMLVAVVLMIWGMGYRNRLVQTLVAMIGASVMISLVLLPGMLVVSFSQQEPKPFGVLLMIESIWRIVLYTHIFRDALSIKTRLAAMLSVSYFIFSIWFAVYLLEVKV